MSVWHRKKKWFEGLQVATRGKGLERAAWQVSQTALRRLVSQPLSDTESTSEEQKLKVYMIILWFWYGF